MAKKKMVTREVKIPRTTPSIWHNIDKAIKFKRDISDDELKFVENFVKQGGKIIDNFGKWVIKKEKLMGRHAKKLDDVKAYKLAWVI
jgi:phage-related tail protein